MQVFSCMFCSIFQSNTSKASSEICLSQYFGPEESLVGSTDLTVNSSETEQESLNYKEISNPLNNRSSHPEVFLGKDVLKICSKFSGEHPRRSVISIKLQNNFIKITLRHGCSPVYLLHIFRIPFPKNTSERQFLQIYAYRNLCN